MARISPKAAGAGLAAVVALATPLVIKWEGERNRPYWDTAGIRSVCLGETQNVQERYYSSAECRQMLAARLPEHAAPILRCLPPAAPIEVKAAFASLGYNIGVGATCGSTAAARARAGDYRGACEAIPRWNKVRNPITRQLEFSQGLANRRADEFALCLRGVT